MSRQEDRHVRLRAVFDEALLQEPSARQRYLDDTCADDPDLRSHVMRLLAIHHDAGSFLEHPLSLLSPPPDEPPFAGTERFRIVRQIGTGGMGIVYEVHDRLRDEVVALKTLRRAGGADLYRLKREFRSLADVTHPNLVCLYELFVEDERCFFTMELVHGVSFVDHVRGPALSRERLLPALRQLVDGVSELHRRGKLHRDIKPSNVLVTAEGRVVILDFGLIAEALSPHAGDLPTGGTPAYMSPEEAAGSAPSEASDWYSVGATLYEAVTGTLPFAGTMSDVLRRKVISDPPAPVNVPTDLVAVCMGLLKRDPAERMTGPAALRGLLPFGDAAGAPDASSRETIERTSTSVDTTPDPPFVGREDQLRALHVAREAVANGAGRVVAVYGPSGIGKSALIRQFLSECDRREGVVALTGRCHENESVPYKALDAVVDQLSRYLASMSDEDVTQLLPSDESSLPALSALTRVFPVLRQVDVMARAARDVERGSSGSTRSEDSGDPIRIRRRAFDALGALLSRLAASRPLVIWIDDLQWADADSAVLLDELLASPQPPAMLTLLSFRREEMAAKPFLQALLDRGDRPEWSAVSLEPMTDEEAHALIDGLLPRGLTLTADDTHRVTREAGGSPFVLEQLALYAGGSRRPAGGTPGENDRPPTLASMFNARLSALPAEARSFLEALALCGRPMAPDVVCDASGVARDRQSLLVMLRASHFIRSSGSSERVETYHDRIRDVLAERLAPAAARDIHRRIAASLVARRSDDCEMLFDHFRGAGDAERASIEADRAAARASAALAFDRAAFFYRHAIDLAPAALAVPAWREALATALANAGLPAEAAEAYLAADEGAQHARHVELRRRAAEQFLIGGHIDRGLALIRSVLESVGLSLASSPRAAAMRLVWRRARLRWRGLEFVPRRTEDVDPETRLRLDTCWAVATGLGLVDIIGGSDFIAWHLQMALDAGELSRIARGMALEAAARSADWTFRGGMPLLAERAKVLSERVGTPPAIATKYLADSIAATATGAWRRARSSSEQALTILQEKCIGMGWETNIAQNMLIWALMYLGEIGEVCRRVPPLLADARRRGNLYLATELCTRCNLVWLAADDPDEGERQMLDAIGRWSQKAFHRQHYSARLAWVQTALYRDDAEEAWRRMEEQQAGLRRSMLMQVQALRVEARYLRARCAIAMAAANPQARRRYLSVAHTETRRITREQMPWSTPLARLLAAGIASVEGRREDMLTDLDAAADGFDRAEMQLYAATARRRIGDVRTDDRGRTLLQESEAWFACQQITNPIFFTRMLAPGLYPVAKPLTKTISAAIG